MKGPTEKITQKEATTTTCVICGNITGKETSINSHRTQSFPTKLLS